MGSALAAAFLAAGHSTTVWNRTPGKADELAARGARRAGSVAEAVAAAPLVVVCVADDEAVHQLLDPLDGALAGRTLVNLTTGTSAQARANAAWAKERGIAFLDGAIMAVPEDIATGDAVLLYSGPRDAFDTYEEALRVLAPAGTTHLGGDAGLAALHDLALLGIMWGVLNGFLHGAALLGTAGVRAGDFAPLAARMTTVVAGYVTAAAPEVDAGSYPAGDATLTVHQEAMRHLAEESEALGVNAELPRFLQPWPAARSRRGTPRAATRRWWSSSARLRGCPPRRLRTRHGRTAVPFPAGPPWTPRSRPPATTTAPGVPREGIGHQQGGHRRGGAHEDLVEAEVGALAGVRGQTGEQDQGGLGDGQFAEGVHHHAQHEQEHPHGAVGPRGGQEGGVQGEIGEAAEGEDADRGGGPGRG